jgi:hypothetical protein
MTFVSTPDIPEPDCDGVLIGIGRGAASPVYAILDSDCKRALLLSCDAVDESKLEVGNPTHPAAATIAKHTTKSAMILLFIQNASPCEIFISVVNFELFCSYPDRVIFWDSYNPFFSDDVTTAMIKKGSKPVPSLLPLCLLRWWRITCSMIITFGGEKAADEIPR